MNIFVKTLCQTESSEIWENSNVTLDYKLCISLAKKAWKQRDFCLFKILLGTSIFSVKIKSAILEVRVKMLIWDEQKAQFKCKFQEFLSKASPSCLIAFPGFWFQIRSEAKNWIQFGSLLHIVLKYQIITDYKENDLMSETGEHRNCCFEENQQTTTSWS